MSEANVGEKKGGGMKGEGLRKLKVIFMYFLLIFVHYVIICDIH